MKQMFIPYKYDSGGITVTYPPRQEDLKPEAQVFSYRANDGSLDIHVDIEKMYRIIRSNPEKFTLITIGLIETQVNHVRKFNGITISQLAMVSAERMNEPGIMLHRRNGMDVVLDGNHRLVKRFMNGLDYIDMWKVSEHDIRPALLKVC